ncbi:hypothetical protein FEAC_14650 [Ferrimicrobium acidiphilum DSM 19497]|uniref:Uncharacterized protein n=1 Tax=Ferrimicrobium acidiphilum DSM 19497 TaxID=1121877 RepID=A0A0D8FX25_9ACTN|nr:hypothetical protein FEAC_14650 [Ferrimicrobium acidiphilum DSM 19497]
MEDGEANGRSLSTYRSPCGDATSNACDNSSAMPAFTALLVYVELYAVVTRSRL